MLLSAAPAGQPLSDLLSQLIDASDATTADDIAALALRIPSLRLLEGPFLAGGLGGRALVEERARRLASAGDLDRVKAVQAGDGVAARGAAARGAAARGAAAEAGPFQASVIVSAAATSTAAIEPSLLMR